MKRVHWLIREWRDRAISSNFLWKRFAAVPFEALYFLLKLLGKMCLPWIFFTSPRLSRTADDIYAPTVREDDWRETLYQRLCCLWPLYYAGMFYQEEETSGGLTRISMEFGWRFVTHSAIPTNQSYHNTPKSNHPMWKSQTRVYTLLKREIYFVFWALRWGDSETFMQSCISYTDQLCGINI